MVNNFKGLRMRIVLFATTLFAMFPISSETLSEAVQHSLILNPEAIFNTTQDLGNAKKPSISHSNHGELDVIVNGLALNRPQDAALKTQRPATIQVFDVVNHYLLVIFEEKRLEIAKANLRVHRAIFLSNTKQKEVAARLAVAESNVLRAQNSLHEAKKKYAKLVGKWPSKLKLPETPTNNALPMSVGQAIEQGLDNYQFSEIAVHELSDGDYDAVFAKDKPIPYPIQKRSMLELSKSIRASWEEWTLAGLKNNTIHKRFLEASLIRDSNQEKFKEGQCSAIALLDSQKRVYQAQIAANQSEYTELAARFRILDSVGTLLPFINTNPSEMAMNTESQNVSQTAMVPEIENIAYPYPDYKPQFDSDIVNTMALTEQIKTAMLSPWYVSVGTFKNKANAVALVNRLQGLGFMAFIETKEKGSSVLIGPYDYPRHATIGMKRLKDIAHVQGVLTWRKQLG